VKILVSSINFAPDHAGIGVYSTDFPAYLAEMGDEVRMVTGFPYYPQWRKRPEDRGRLFRRDHFRGIEVLRGYLYVPARVSAPKRIWHELTFCIFAGVNLLRAGRHDALVLFAPPYFLGFSGVLWKWIFRRPLVINVQDLPLDAALALGMLREGLVSRIFRRMEGWIYKRADLVTSISPEMVNTIRAKGVGADRLALCPNWIDVAAASAPVERGRFLAAQVQARDKFTVVYAGNLGVKQGIEVLLHAAKALEDMADLHFFVIGDGADKRRLLAIAAALELKNCTFLPFLGTEAYAEMLTDVDVVFVAQRLGAGNNFMPSKLLGIMAREKALLVVADLSSELAHAVADSGCGLVSAYGNLAGLIANLGILRAMDPVERGRMGARGLGKVREFDRQRVLGDLRARIEALAARRAASPR